MKFKIKGEENKNELIELWLEEGIEGGINTIFLCGRDRDRDRKKTLFRFKNGKFHRLRSAELKGLETDSLGRILEEEE